MRLTSPFILILMARTPDEQGRERRRQQILDAAARVFKDKGFHLARTDDICREAGTSAGTVFRYFADKRALILAIAEVELEQYREDVEAIACEEGMRWMSQISGKDLKELVSPTQYNLGADSWLELSRDAEVRQKFLDQYHALKILVGKALAQGQKQGWAKPDFDPQGMATVLLSACSGLQFDLEIGAKVNFAATARELAALVTYRILAE